MTRVAIVGGGPGGLAAALFLGRRGHRVTLFERDGHRPGADLDGDFFDWHRPGVPHAVQPHGLLAPVRTVLRAEAPDVYRAMLRMGARERNELDWFAERPPARPGDEDLVTVQTRRIVLEAALHDAVRREPEVDVRLGEPVEDFSSTGAATCPGSRGCGPRRGRTRRSWCSTPAGAAPRCPAGSPGRAAGTRPRRTTWWVSRTSAAGTGCAPTDHATPDASRPVRSRPSRSAGCSRRTTASSRRP